MKLETGNYFSEEFGDADESAEADESAIAIQQYCCLQASKLVQNG